MPRKPRTKSPTPDGVNYQKPRTNVYTMMLILSLIAICTALVLQYLMLKGYEPDYWKAPRAQMQQVERGHGIALILPSDVRRI